MQAYRAMDRVHIGEAARQLGVTPHHLRILEYRGRIPSPPRDFNDRTYSESDIALLRSMGIGSKPRRLKSVEEVLGGVR
jgi:DNA-binding transcriptional MerR regulator